MRAPDRGTRDRVSAPADLLSRRSVLLAVTAGLALLLGGSLLVAVATAYGLLGLGPNPAREAEREARLRALVREAEATLPGYPDAVRLAEREGATRLGTAPA